MAAQLIDGVRAVLDDLDYPASKDEIVAHAERRGATGVVLRAVRALPIADYQNEAEVLRSIPVDADELEGRTVADKARERRQHAHPGLGEHMREVERSPIEEELGYNKGS
jgi:hypothetical protein